jgi:hypothetical protein
LALYNDEVASPLSAARNDKVQKPCHCEERSDEANSSLPGLRSCIGAIYGDELASPLSAARNDKVQKTMSLRGAQRRSKLFATRFAFMYWRHIWRRGCFSAFSGSQRQSAKIMSLNQAVFTLANQ